MMGEYHRSLGLGALPVPASQDPILRSASQAAREILSEVERHPKRDRSRVLSRLLEQESPGLSNRVLRTALKLRWKRQVSREDALYHALRLAIADETLDFFVEEGSRQRSGGTLMATAGLGRAERLRKFGRFLGGAVRGAACAEGSADFASQLASRQGERAASGADLGVRAVRGLVDCEGGLPPAEDLPPERPEIPVVPLVIGGIAVAGLLTLVLVMRK